MLVGEEFAKKGIRGFLEPHPVRPLKEKLAIRFVSVLKVSEVPEREVGEAIKAMEAEFPLEQGKFPAGIRSIRTGSCETAYDVMTYGSFDDFDYDSLEQFASYSMEGRELPEIEPTTRSVSIFLYPTNMSFLSDALKVFNVLGKMTEVLATLLPNQGWSRYVYFFMEPSKVPYLLRATSEVLPNNIQPWKDGQANHGVLVTNPTDLQLKKLLGALVGQFAGMVRRTMKKAESTLLKDMD